MTDTDRCVDFLRRLIRTRSMPGEEGDAARLVAEEMRELAYSDVSLDGAGNVIGRVAGAGHAPAVMFNTHLDHVDAGDPGAWEHDPFGGELEDGRVWGRGAVDIKGPLAAQVHGVARLAAGEPPPGDVYVTAVVQEEVGGVGARHLAAERSFPLIVVGEPSRNELRRGHRGRVELRVAVRGRSAHASAPERGVSPLPSLAAFLLALDRLRLPEHPELGPSTLAPTLMGTDQVSANVIPGEAWVVCDCRTVPGQTAADVRALLLPLLEEGLRPGTEGSVEVTKHARRSWAGLEVEIPADNPAYVLPADHPALAAAAEVLEPALGRRPAVGFWRFATDGGHFARAGLTVVGFGPGDEALAHTVRESIEVEELAEAVDGYEALARGWPAAVAARGD